jgi:hypothetical protein
MIRDYMLFPHLRTMVERSIGDIEHSKDIFKKLYLAVGHTILKRINQEWYDLRRELLKRNIRITKDEQEDFLIYQSFVCRGYEDRIGVTRDVMRSEISLRLSRYIKPEFRKYPSLKI